MLLYEMTESARALFLSLKYPLSEYPVDDDDNPIIKPRWHDWIIRAAAEMYLRMGSEGQISHSEISQQRQYESGTISTSLRAEITPVVRISS